ncbi:hypothetical protein PENSPDRAFT_484678 [Peniophora sp. CONT]|nr:hypothetical protein PENSPDRAFT_484678 [Peniophora sp. CONT]
MNIYLAPTHPSRAVLSYLLGRRAHRALASHTHHHTSQPFWRSSIRTLPLVLFSSALLFCVVPCIHHVHRTVRVSSTPHPPPS